MPNYYNQRLNLVLNHINKHVNGDLSLAVLADVAGFSPYHFHRIFKTLVGENLNNFVVRKKLERAVALLKASPRTSLTQVAFDCGFRSSSDFSRTFKKYFDIPPSRWDRISPLRDSKIRQAESGLPLYHLDELSHIAAQAEFAVGLKSFPACRVAYIRVADAYVAGNLLQAYERLMGWVERHAGHKRGLLIGMSQDDPDVTPLSQCRYDICLTVDEAINGDEEVSVRLLPACRLAYIHCAGDIEKVDRAWQYLYRYWLPNSNYVPDNLPAIELYRQTPDEIGWLNYDLECAIPIVPFPHYW